MAQHSSSDRASTESNRREVAFGLLGTGVAGGLTMLASGITVVLLTALGVILFPVLAVAGLAAGGKRYAIRRRQVDRRVWTPAGIVVGTFAITLAGAVALAVLVPLVMPAVIAAGVLFIATVVTVGDVEISTSQREERERGDKAEHRDASRGRLGPVFNDLWNADLFRELTEPQTRLIEEISDVERLDGGSRLPRIASRVYVVVSGAVRLELEYPGGITLTRDAAGEEAFPLLPLLGKRSEVVCATAIGETTVWFAEIDALSQLISERADIRSRLMDTIASLVEKRTARLREDAKGSAGDVAGEARSKAA